MKKLRSLWKDFLKKGFAILTIFMMLGQLGQGAITAFANELAVGYKRREREADRKELPQFGYYQRFCSTFK